MAKKMQNECILQIRISKKRIKVEPGHILVLSDSPIKQIFYHLKMSSAPSHRITSCFVKTKQKQESKQTTKNF